MLKVGGKQMYFVQIENSFEAAHKLREYKGKCANVHGHNFKVKVELKAEKLNELGMVEDFIDLEKKLNEITNKLDHKLINEVPPFDKINPTAERLAEYVFQELKPAYRNNVKINKVQVFENDRYAATFME